jgi:hypothetical protein
VTIAYFHCGGAASMIRHRVPSSSVCHSEIRIVVRGAADKMPAANCCAHRLHRSAPREHKFLQSTQRDVFTVAAFRHSLLPRGVATTRPINVCSPLAARLVISGLRLAGSDHRRGGSTVFLCQRLLRGDGERHRPSALLPGLCGKPRPVPILRYAPARDFAVVVCGVGRLSGMNGGTEMPPMGRAASTFPLSGPPRGRQSIPPRAPHSCDASRMSRHPPGSPYAPPDSGL